MEQEQDGRATLKQGTRVKLKIGKLINKIDGLIINITGISRQLNQDPENWTSLLGTLSNNIRTYTNELSEFKTKDLQDIVAELDKYKELVIDDNNPSLISFGSQETTMNKLIENLEEVLEILSKTVKGEALGLTGISTDLDAVDNLNKDLGSKWRVLYGITEEIFNRVPQEIPSPQEVENPPQEEVSSDSTEVRNPPIIRSTDYDLARVITRVLDSTGFKSGLVDVDKLAGKIAKHFADGLTLGDKDVENYLRESLMESQRMSYSGKTVGQIIYERLHPDAKFGGRHPIQDTMARYRTTSPVPDVTREPLTRYASYKSSGNPRPLPQNFTRIMENISKPDTERDKLIQAFRAYIAVPNSTNYGDLVSIYREVMGKTFTD